MYVSYMDGTPALDRTIHRTTREAEKAASRILGKDWKERGYQIRVLTPELLRKFWGGHGLPRPAPMIEPARGRLEPAAYRFLAEKVEREYLRGVPFWTALQEVAGLVGLKITKEDA